MTECANRLLWGQTIVFTVWFSTSRNIALLALQFLLSTWRNTWLWLTTNESSFGMQLLFMNSVFVIYDVYMDFSIIFHHLFRHLVLPETLVFFMHENPGRIYDKFYEGLWYTLWVSRSGRATPNEVRVAYAGGGNSHFVTSIVMILCRRRLRGSEPLTGWLLRYE